MGDYPLLFLSILALSSIHLNLSQPNYVTRLMILLFYSSVFLLSISLFLFLSAVSITLILNVFQKFSYKKWKFFNGIIFFCCLCPVFLNDFQSFGVVDKAINIFGAGFLGIRSFLIFDKIKKGNIYNVPEIGLFLSFFPLFISGPIMRPANFFDELKELKVSIRLCFKSVGRFFIGLCKVFFFGVIMVGIAESYLANNEISIITLWIYCICSWLSLYLIFSGFSDISIVSCKCLGISAPENFNSPFLSRSIAEYWQRWNITLMSVVSEFVYKKFVRFTGRRVVGFYVSFLVMGMWHEISVDFLFHSIIHATSFLVYFYFTRSYVCSELKNSIKKNKYIKWVYDFICNIITISVVSVASGFGAVGLIDVFV